MNAIFNRTSVRKFTEEKVSKEDINLILKAAMQAPSAGNNQPWEFYIVEDEERKLALSKAHQYSGFAKDAPLIIVPVARKEGLVFPMYSDIDMSICCENIWLECTELGLGCTWLGIAPIKERMDYVNKVLNIPDHLDAFSIMVIGHPLNEPKPKDRFDESRIHY